MKGFVEPPSDILQYLRMHRLERGNRLFSFQKAVGFRDVGQRRPELLVGFLALREESVIQPATVFQGVLNHFLVGMVGVQSVFVRLAHEESASFP